MNWLVTTKRNREMAPFALNAIATKRLAEAPLAHAGLRESYLLGGAPDTIRTCGLRLRRATLYPAELRVPALLTQCLRGNFEAVKRSAPIS